MTSELINVIKNLQKMIITKNNEQFKKDAVEIINPSKVDEDMFCAPAEPFANDEIDENPEGNVVEPTVDTPPEGTIEELPITPGRYLRIEEMIRKSIAEEQEAAACYIKRARKCFESEDTGDYRLGAMFQELAYDEIVHAASLETALDMYGMFDPQLYMKGQEEAEYVLVRENKEDMEQKADKAEEDAEKIKKEFDFVGEYTKDKAKYNKEKIVNAINDVILGKTAVEDLVDAIAKVAKETKRSKKKDKKEN